VELADMTWTEVREHPAERLLEPLIAYVKDSLGGVCQRS